MQIEPFVINNSFPTSLGFHTGEISMAFPSCFETLGVYRVFVVKCEIRLAKLKFFERVRRHTFIKGVMVAEDDRSVIKRWKEFLGIWLSSCWEHYFND